MGRRKDGFETKINKALDNALKKMSSDISEEISSEYISVIQDFYIDYKPKYYRRKFNLYHGWGYISGVDKNKKYKYEDGFYISGINVSSDFLEDDAYFSQYYKKTTYTPSASEYAAAILKGEIPSGIKQELTNVENDWVFDRAFFKGIHGFNRTDKKEWNEDKDVNQPKFNPRTIPKTMIPSPDKRLEKQINRKYTYNKITDMYAKYVEEELKRM